VRTVGGGADAMVGRHQIHRRMLQSGAVLEIDAVGRPPVAAAAAPAGVGNNLILDR